MTTRREWLRITLGAGAALSLDPRWLAALEQGQLITRSIPGSGERIPAVGLGSSATFSRVARSEDVSALRAVLTRMVELGGRVFDTAPGYGASEEVAGRIAQEAGLGEKIFWATKLNVARGGSVDAAQAHEQVETSFRRVGRKVIDLIQVHNMGAPEAQLPILHEYKQQKRIRYLGITTTSANQYSNLIDVMKSQPLDFIGVDYAVDNRDVEDTILPLARDRGIAVLAYAPFGRTRLWRRVGERPVPEYAKEFGAKTWAQFFLKFVISHPAVTAATPATSKPENMADNIGGMIGALPDEAIRRRMIATVDALPDA